jgi:hypothetical protein
MQQPPKSPKSPRQIRLEVPNNLNAIYSNVVLISQTTSEIIFDFVQVMPNSPQARVQSRIVMTPTNAKALLSALQQNLDRFEDKNGEIKLPPKPTTLADQLFGNIGQENSDDGDNNDGDDSDSK